MLKSSHCSLPIKREISVAVPPTIDNYNGIQIAGAILDPDCGSYCNDYLLLYLLKMYFMNTLVKWKVY